MMRVGQILRLININRVLVKHGLDEIVFATHLFRPVRLILYLLPWNWIPRKRERRAVRIRKTLEELGPIFVKFGQIVSTRRDLLPEELANELSRLQDQVPSFPGEQAKGIIEHTLGQGVDELFAEFDITPLASASIAQVHTAKLHDGRAVIVKVVRPGIAKIIRRDVSLLYILAKLAERYWAEGRRLRLTAIVAEFEKTLIDELDMSREGANASQLRRNFEDSGLLYVPEVYWPYTRRDVMVMERIEGIAVSDIKSLEQQNIDLKELSERGVEIFFTQVFQHNFFHADMHPGNIFVSPEGQYIAVDFGIMGTLSQEDQRYLAENFLAFFNRDYRRVAELHVQSGWIPGDTRVDEFESAIRTVCEPIFERPLKEISFGRLLIHLFQTARRFNMEIQPQLVLLQKTLLNIEGLGRQLYPDLDLWATAKPFLERWMRDSLGVSAFVDKIKTNGPSLLEKLPQIPGLAFEVLKKANDGTLKVQWQSQALEDMLAQTRRAHNRLYIAMVAATLVISGVIFATLDLEHDWLGLPIISWGLWSLGLLLFYMGWRNNERAD